MKNKPVLIVLSFLFIYTCSFSQSAACAYKYRKRITFDPTKVSGTADLLNFTALVNITSDNDLRTVGNSGHVENANGYDIIFTADDGVTQLDHQLEKYTANTGELIAWVRIPALSGANNTYIYMYYGNTAISADPSVNSTWNSAYKGVWHLHNNVFSDGTSNGNNATNNGSTNMASAKIGGGRTFPGTNTNYVQLPLTGASGGNGNGSVALWGMITTFEASTYFFGATTTQTGMGYANRVQLYTNDAAGTLYLGLGGTHALLTNVQTMALNTWYHIALTWSANATPGTGTYSIFVNGVQKGSAAYSAFTAIHSFADIGNDGNASQRTEELTGNIDEVHVTNTTLSSDWIITEYNNQNSPSTFYSISAEPKVWVGNSGALFSLGTNWQGGVAAASGDDVIFNNGTFQPTLLGSLQLNSVFIRAGATFATSTFNLSIRADITNCGTLDGSLGGVIMNSAAGNFQNQSLSGSGTYNLNNLTINNTFSTSPSVTLNKDVNVSGGLTLTSGIVYTSATNILALGTSATSSSGSSSSFVSGPMSKAGTGSFVFPIGKGSLWRRASLTGISSASTFRAEYFDTPYANISSVNSPLDNMSHLEYWQIDQVSGSGTATLSLYWESATLSGINNCPDLTIARWNGSSWDERPGTTTGASSCTGAGTGTVVSNAAITAFSPFTFGSKLTTVNPLPIELLSFEAVCYPQELLLNWSTASENNSDYFTLSRSLDGINWTELERTKAGGNSFALKKYSFSDPEGRYADVLYYKLSLVDRDGRSRELKILSVSCAPVSERMLLYPNPAHKEITIQFKLSRNYGTGKIKVIDNLGRPCYQQGFELLKGLSEYSLPADLLPGAYTVLFSSGDLVLPAQRLIVR